MNNVLLHFFCVAAGGAIGASGRYAIGLAMQSFGLRAFPFATLTVNILGSFLLGLLLAYGQQQSVSETTRLFLGVGVLGAFTTFSTFSVEVVTLASQGEMLKAALHIGLNVIICIAAVVAAMMLYSTTVK